MIEKNCIGEIIEGKCSDARSRIIRAGLEEFSVNLPAAARTRKIAAKAGVNHAAINYYFGGKDGLYMEIARQMTEFIQEYSEPFFVRAAEISKTRDAESAKKLLKDYLMSRVCVESEAQGEFMRWIIMIITREEVYETKIFDIFYKGAFKRAGEMLSELVEVASKSKITGENALVLSEMLVGQMHMFNSSRAGFMRMNSWKEFGKTEYGKLEKSLEFMLDSLFA